MVREGRTQEFGQFYEGGNRMRVEMVCSRSYSSRSCPKSVFLLHELLEALEDRCLF